MTLPIPARVVDLTPEWMTAALQARHPEYTVPVRAVHPDVLVDNAGAMSEAIRCRLEYAAPNGGGPPSVFVKCAVQHDQNRAVARQRQLYRREVWFYTQAAPRSSPALPHCYWAAHDPTTDAMVVVLEDVVGAVRPDAREGFSPTQAMAVVQVLAAIHAAAWARPDIPFPAVLAQSSVSPEEIESSVARFGIAWHALRGRVGSLLPEADVAAWLQAFGTGLTPDRQRTLLAAVGRMPWTLVHGDLHAHNILWRPDGAGCVVLDWQTCGAGPAVLDLAYFVGGNGADPRETTAVLRAYHAALPPAVRDAYPWDRLANDYGWALLSCLRYVLLLGGTIDLRNRELHTLYTAVLHRLTAAAQARFPHPTTDW